MGISFIDADELSFCDAALIAHLDNILRQMLDEPDVPFGGLLVIFGGDMFQLPPP